MFLGYAENCKAYKLWDSDLHEVVVSRDVTFDESSSDRSGEVMDTTDDLPTDDETINLCIDDEVVDTDPEHVVASEASTTSEQKDSDDLSNSSAAGEDHTAEIVNNHTVEEQVPGQQTNVRRSTRVRKAPMRFGS